MGKTAALSGNFVQLVNIPRNCHETVTKVCKLPRTSAFKGLTSPCTACIIVYEVIGKGLCSAAFSTYASRLRVCAPVNSDIIWIMSDHTKDSAAQKSGAKYNCYLFFKRMFDILSSGFALLLFSWLFLILALAVKLSDGGTVFYRHKRVGKNGKDIFIPKFRSMKRNADKLEDMLTPEQLEQYKREYKIDNDPRITKVGKFLRRTSLDELPQIWSIFIGQLSVVGPRPLMRDELDEKYGKDADKLLSVKPGLIGYWASHGRSNCTYESGERQKMELYYVDNRSAWMDTKIIFKTIAGVIRRDGAM